MQKPFIRFPYKHKKILIYSPFNSKVTLGLKFKDEKYRRTMKL